MTESKINLAPNPSSVSQVRGHTLIFNDPRLLAPPNPLHKITNDVRRDVQILLQELHASNLQALASPLIGIHRHMLAFRNGSQILILLNPKIIRATAFELVLHEQCMCTPLLSRATWRPTEIEVQFSALTGAAHTMTAKGPSAQLLAQHIEYLTGPMPQDKMTKYELKLASLVQFGMPVPEIELSIYQSTANLRALPGKIALLKGTEECGYQAVWKNERILNLIKTTKGQLQLLYSLDTRSPLNITLEVEQRLMTCLSLLQSPESKILMAGLDDIFLHFKISQLFPNYEVNISEADSNRLSFAQYFAGGSSKNFEVYAPNLADAFRRARGSKLDAIISSDQNQFFINLGEKELEKSVRMASKGLKSDGFLFLRLSSDGATREGFRKIFLKVFPKVYEVIARDGSIIIGARNEMELADWEGEAYNEFQNSRSDILFSPELCQLNILVAKS